MTTGRTPGADVRAAGGQDGLFEDSDAPDLGQAPAGDALRPHDLIFACVVSNWLLGEDPPAFDILSWKADGTRMAGRVHGFYLRALYVDDLLTRGELGGDVRYVLSSGRHIAGAVNPPGPKAWHLSPRHTRRVRTPGAPPRRDLTRPGGRTGRRGARSGPGAWWRRPGWGPRVHPPLRDAPGDYIGS